MSQVEAPNYLRKWEFGDSASYAEWPKVADAVIKAHMAMITQCRYPFRSVSSGTSGGRRREDGCHCADAV